ncbi:MAG TPA: TonB-dependent receptor, partial [Opitutaceae bacterium]|nr:TonB-dependent receptor [Opitutaceae bacterium]
MHSRHLSRALAVLAAALPWSLRGQTSPAAPSDDTVVLSPFQVTAASAGPYQVLQGLSGGRIAENLFTSTDDVSIVTQQFMQDTDPRDTFNAVKYLAGIANNSSQIAGDRVSIRGFQVSNPDIDGFDTVQSVVKDDPALYESIEFVRGPDSLLAPNGSPGGTLNLVSKTAQFANFGSATVQFGEYDTNSGSIDVNQMLNPTTAFRVVASVIDATQGDNQGYHESVAAMPSVLFKFGDNSQLLLHATYFWGTAYNYLGIPINPATRSISDTIQILPGLNDYETPYADNIDDPSSANHSNRMIYRALFTSNLNDNLSVRLAARYLWDWETNNQWNLTGNAGGGYDPLTGLWTPGLVWSGTAATGFTSSPAPAISPNYALSQSPTNDLDHYLDIQNDWVYRKNFNGVGTETIAGAAAEVFHTQIWGYSATNAPINIYDIPAAEWTPSTKPVTDQDVIGNWEQVYVNERLSFFNDHLLANASVVPTWFYEDVTNYLSGVASQSHPNPTFVNYGVDYVPVDFLSLFYSHSADAAQISPPSPPTAINPNPPQLQSGKQDQAGFRLKFLNGRATASVTYFQLYQTNNAIVNPALFSVPPPTVSPPNIYSDRIARGWEFEFNTAITPNLSLLGSWSQMTNRSPYDVRFRADPEHYGAVYLNYRFLDGQLKGLSLGVGYVYQGKAAGDSASGVTAASTTTNEIPEQPSFYLPAYGLLNLTASYQLNRHWTVRFFLDNATNQFYYAGSLNANAV